MSEMDELRKHLEKRFTALEVRFDDIGKRLDLMRNNFNARLDRIEILVTSITQHATACKELKVLGITSSAPQQVASPSSTQPITKTPEK